MADADKLHRAVLGVNQVAARELTAPSQGLALGDTADDLFSLWVHRLVSINASVAATMGWKMVLLGSDPDARRVLQRSGRLRPLAKATRTFLADGQADGMRVPASVRKATRYRLDDAVEVEQHAAIDLLQQANPWTDGYGLMEATYADLQLFSSAYWFNVRSDGGNPTELWRMMPDRIRPVADPETFVSGFNYRMDGGATERFAPGDVVWFRRYSPGNPYQGRGELAAWMDYAKAAGYVAKFNSNLFKKSGTPDHLVVTPHPVSEGDKRAFRSRWRRLFGKLFDREETVAFLSGDVRLERLGQTSRELEFSESSRLVRDFLAAGFGVPKALLTPEDANRAVTKEATDQHLRLTVWPLACRVFDTINEQLLPRFGQQLLVVPDNPVRTDAATRVAERQSKLSSGYTVNELRREDGAEPLDDHAADVPMVAAGIRPLDQAVAPPAAPPSPFGATAPSADGDPDDGDDAPDGDQDEDAAGEEPEDGGASARAGQRAAAPAVRRCRELAGEPEAGVYNQAKLLRPQVPSLAELDRLAKASVPDDPEDVRMLARTVAAAIRQLRAVLGSVADSITEPESAATALAGITDDVVQTLTEDTAGDLRRIVTAEGQAVINGLRPGIGVQFNGTNELVLDYVRDSAARIADTVATTYTEATIKQLRSMVQAGANPREAARALAMTNRVEEWMARRLARTEARFASAVAQDEGMAQSGVVEAKRFVLSSDPCEICEAVDSAFGDINPSREFRLRRPMFPNGFSVDLPPGKNGQPRSYVMDYLGGGQPGPPIHPNCRCTMRAVLIGA